MRPVCLPGSQLVAAQMKFCMPCGCQSYVLSPPTAGCDWTTARPLHFSSHQVACGCTNYLSEPRESTRRTCTTFCSIIVFRSITWLSRSLTSTSSLIGVGIFPRPRVTSNRAPAGDTSIHHGTQATGNRNTDAAFRPHQCLAGAV